MITNEYDLHTAILTLSFLLSCINPCSHGFSSFAFVPGTKDRHALALRSVEEDCAGDDLDVCKQRSYFVIFDVLTGEVLMDEVQIEQPMKFEGVEFVDMYTIPK